MKYIDYMNQFWRSAAKSPMSASEVALYAFLVNECNINYWKMPITCSTMRICETLHLSKQTVILARADLAKRRLIAFSYGKSRFVPSKYSLIELTDRLTEDVTDKLTDDFSPIIIKDKDKDNYKTKKSNYDSNSSKNRRRGVKEVLTTASSYEGSF